MKPVVYTKAQSAHIHMHGISLHPQGGEDAYDDEDDSSCKEEDNDEDDSHDQEDNDDGISEEDGEEDEEGKKEFSSKREESPPRSTSSSYLTLLHCNVHGTWTLSTSPENAPTASCPMLSIDAHAVSLFETATYHARVLHQKYRGMFEIVRGDDKGVVDDFSVLKA